MHRQRKRAQYVDPKPLCPRRTFIMSLRGERKGVYEFTSNIKNWDIIRRPLHRGMVQSIMM